MEGILLKLSKEIRNVKARFDLLLTEERASKLDNLNASITSRAAQSTVNDIKSRVTDIREVLSDNELKIYEAHQATKILTNSPASGKIVKFRRNLKAATNGIASIGVANVSGSGVLRFVQGLSISKSIEENCKINIDGTIIDLLDTEYAEAFFNGGIRFNKYFKIAIRYRFVGDTTQYHSVELNYGYTLGD